MNDDYNPYAPPTALPDEPARRAPSWDRDDTSTAWQENGQVVVPKLGGELPDRCVVCNRPTDYKHKQTFQWHPPAYYVLVCAGWIVYLIVMLIVRKTATVELGLCDEHRVRRKNGLIIAGVGFIGAFAAMLLASSSRWTGLMVVSVVAMIALPLVGTFMARVATVAKIDDTHLWLKAGEPFVASLPLSPDEAPARPPVKKKKKKKKPPAPPTEG